MEYKILTPDDTEYPKKLKERLGSECPQKLYYNGNLELLNRITMSVICADKECGIALMETHQVLFTVREYNLNYSGGWYSVIETEIFRLGLYKGYKFKTKKPALFGQKTVTLFSAKGLKNESYDSFLLDRFYPPLHTFPEREEYFRQAKEGELLMLSVCEPDETRQSRKNIMERNWIACNLGDIIFIPFGSKGTKTYTTAKKVLKANLPVFTIDNADNKDLLELGIPGFNRKNVRSFLEKYGAEIRKEEDSEREIIQYSIPETPSNVEESKIDKQLNLFEKK